MKRYLIEGSCDGNLFTETIDAENQEQAEALAVERLKEAWGEPDAECLDDLGDCATVREYGPDDYMRDAAPDLLAALESATEWLSLITESNDLNDDDRERLASYAAAIAKARGEG